MERIQSYDETGEDIMAKQFYTTGEGAQQTLTAADQSEVKVYDSKTDMDTDISNIAEGEIVATKAGESEGVVEVVDEVTDGVMNPVTSNAVADCLSYSTTEQPTGGTWIDGKPIYRIVLDSTTAISSGAVSIDVASLHIESLVRMDGFFRVTGSPRYAKFPLQMYVHSSGNGMYLTMDEGNTKLLGNIDYSATQGYQIILEYTKA